MTPCPFRLPFIFDPSFIFSRRPFAQLDLSYPRLCGQVSALIDLGAPSLPGPEHVHEVCRSRYYGGHIEQAFEGPHSMTSLYFNFLDYLTPFEFPAAGVERPDLHTFIVCSRCDPGCPTARSFHAMLRIPPPLAIRIEWIASKRR